MLRREVERAAWNQHCGLGAFYRDPLIAGVMAVFDGNWFPETIDDPPLGGTLCDLCWQAPTSWEFAVVEPSASPDVEPTFELRVHEKEPYRDAVCRHCATRKWVTWEADMAAILGSLRRGSPVAKDAAEDLEKRFEDRLVRVDETPRECHFCHRVRPCLRGWGSAVCDRCMAGASAVFERRALVIAEQEAEARRRRAEERQLPFPDDVRAAAVTVAAQLRVRRAQVLGPPEPPPPRALDDARWDEMRSWFATSSSYSSMCKYEEQTAGLTPPVDLVDLVGTGLARIVEHEALNGYRQRDKAQFTDEVSVLGDRWVPSAVGRLLWEGRMSPDVREKLDVGLELLRVALARGACYMEYDDQIYEDVSWAYIHLVNSLHDYRKAQAGVLHEGAILLHGGRPEDREQVAREIHLARTGGLDERLGMPFAILGEGEGRSSLRKVKSEATVYIPDPLALSRDEQALLALRLATDGPPQPTLLGADDEATFREQAQSRLLGELVPRLYTFELDLRLELSRRDTAAR
jgi:hypothetical protein